MAKVEYRVCAVRGDSPERVADELNATLKNLSDEGWRFVETIYAQNSLPLLLFKKQTKLNVSFGEEQPAAAPARKTAKQK